MNGCPAGTPVGINERVAIPEDLLELLDRTQRAPLSRRHADETHGPRSKLSGNFSMSMKYFKTPGMPPLYSGVTDTRPLASSTACAKGVKLAGLAA